MSATVTVELRFFRQAYKFKEQPLLSRSKNIDLVFSFSFLFYFSFNLFFIFLFLELWG